MWAVAGEQFGIGQWYQIGQSQITAFADATEDHQWIHVDPERAAQSPSKKTIAHGFLTLSLIPRRRP
jgi:acyl dehydratase